MVKSKAKTEADIDKDLEKKFKEWTNSCDKEVLLKMLPVVADYIVFFWFYWYSNLLYPDYKWLLGWNDWSFKSNHMIRIFSLQTFKISRNVVQYY